MILNNSVFAKSFAYCTVYQSQNELTTYHNQGNGHFHEYIYIIEGNAEYCVSDDKYIPKNAEWIQLVPGVMYDIGETLDKYVITRTTSVGCSMIMFNPVPHYKALDVKILTTEQEINTKVNERTTVVCITGPITINDKRLETLQYGAVFPGKDFKLEIPKNSICAIVTG